MTLQNEFSEWILKIGNGTIEGMKLMCDEDATWIKIPKEYMIHCIDNPIHHMVDEVYPNFSENYNNIKFLQERAIVTPKNDIADDINEYMLSLIDSNEHEYYSYDSFCPSSGNPDELDAFYPIELLNTLKFNGMPSHEIKLKIGLTIMLLRNINQSESLCNGTRLIITQLYETLIEAKIISGKNTGKKVFIPRIIMSAHDTKMSFILRRRHFPIKPCYAMTINKSQGQSLNRVGIFLPEPVFSHGQLYVAISRATTPSGLHFYIKPSKDLPDDTTKNIVYKEVLPTI